MSDSLFTERMSAHKPKLTSCFSPQHCLHYNKSTSHQLIFLTCVGYNNFKEWVENTRKRLVPSLSRIREMVIFSR